MKKEFSNSEQINAIYGKIPPQALEVEEAVLGALMLEQDAIKTILGIVNKQSFYKTEHQIIFGVVESILVKEEPVDLLTVTQELKNQNLLEQVGGLSYITSLTRRVASSAHIESHARIIAEKYYLRETIRKSTELIKMAFEGEDVEVISNEWKQFGDSLDDIFAIANTGSHIKQVLKNTIQEIELDCQTVNQMKSPGIPTGFSSLDDITGGWRGGNLIILAARPGVGKTSFALYFALQAAKAGFWVNIFSLEMNKEDLARILLAYESGIYRSNIRDGNLKSTDWVKINSVISRIEKLPIIFRDASGMNVNQIQASIRKNRKNNRCQFAIVDYLQLVKSSQLRAIREMEVSEISRTLKTIALNENIPIMALSQLNRAADGELPKLSHLRESGAIEQDADLVCFLHKFEQKNDKIRFTVAKHRRGRLGEIDIYHNDQMTAFSEYPINDNAEVF